MLDWPSNCCWPPGSCPLYPFSVGLPTDKIFKAKARCSWLYFSAIIKHNTLTAFVFKSFFLLAGADWFMDTFSPHISIVATLFSNPITLISYSTKSFHGLAGHPLSCIPTTPNVKTLPTSISYPLLNTCPNHLKRCLLNHPSIDSALALPATSKLVILSLNAIIEHHCFQLLKHMAINQWEVVGMALWLDHSTLVQRGAGSKSPSDLSHKVWGEN